MTTVRVLTILGLLTILAPSVMGQFVQEKEITDNGKHITYQEMQIAVTDASALEPIVTDVRVNGIHPKKTTVFKAISDTIFEIKNYRLYSVSCVEKGFMYYTEKFWPDEKMIHLQKVELHPIEVGLKTDIREIIFLGDKVEIYHTSRPALAQLIEWLELNPNVSVSVIGHVNGPDNNHSKRFYQKASEDRSRAVVAYLVEKGIDPERLSVDGKGNSQMIYENPSTDWQNKANRRIEIEITGVK
jgi:outer membrane protein OmpA-like peptidoglycan-associated protein